MTENTSESFLEGLRRNDQTDWDRLVDIYAPFIRRMVTSQHLTGVDVDDVTQDIIAVVVKNIAAFDRQRTGSFRAWLRAIAVNCIRDHRRKAQKAGVAGGGSAASEYLQQLEDENSDLSQRWNAEHDAHIMRQLLAQVQNEFEPKTCEAFVRQAIDHERAQDVAAALGLTTNAAYVARSKVMTRLRALAGELLD